MRSFFDREDSPRNIDYSNVDNLLNGLMCIYGVYPNRRRCEGGECKGGRGYAWTCPTYKEYRRRISTVE